MGQHFRLLYLLPAASLMLYLLVAVVVPGGTVASAEIIHSNREDRPDGRTRDDIAQEMYEARKRSQEIRLEAQKLSGHKNKRERADERAAERRRSRLDTEMEIEMVMEKERAKFFRDHGPVTVEGGDEFDAGSSARDRHSRHHDLKRKYSASEEYASTRRGGRPGSPRGRYSKEDGEEFGGSGSHERSSRHQEALKRRASHFRSRAEHEGLPRDAMDELDSLVAQWLREEEELMDFRTRSKSDRVQPEGDMRDPEVREAFRAAISRHVEARKEEEKERRDRVAAARAKIDALLNSRPGGGDEM